MEISIAKYFWDLNYRALKDTKKIIKNPSHYKFRERMVTLLSRCDRPKELFSLISKEEFIKVWPEVRRYWVKISRVSDFRDWWETVYEQILQKNSARFNRGEPSLLFSRLGKIIKSARVRKGLSQSSLALKVRISQPDISMLEEGKNNVTLATLERVCKVLDIKKIEIK